VAEPGSFLQEPYRRLTSLLGGRCTLHPMSMRRLATGASALAVACVVVGVAAAAAPVTGTLSGPVTAVKGSTFTITTTLSPTGKSTIDVSKSTTIVGQETVASSTLKTGDCVMATGAKSSKGVVTAQRISLTASVKGKCTVAFGRGGGGGRPTGGTRPPGTGAGGAGGAGGGGGGFGNSANFGFAFGAISAVKGDTLTVKGTLGGKAVTTTVTVSAKTQISKMVDLAVSAVAVKDCAFVSGTSTDKGVTVNAKNVNITKPTSTGCRFGFAGR
jgi:hypothetical protein